MRRRWWWWLGAGLLFCLPVLLQLSMRSKLSRSADFSGQADVARKSWSRLSSLATEAVSTKRLHQQASQSARQDWQGADTAQQAQQTSQQLSREHAAQCQRLLQQAQRQQRLSGIDANAWVECSAVISMLQKHITGEAEAAMQLATHVPSWPRKLGLKPSSQSMAAAVDGPDAGLGDAGQQERLCVIVPYRDRATQLAILAPYMHQHLLQQGIPFQLYVAEQLGTSPFNRGLLTNLAALAVEPECDYLAVHDVDLLPLPGVSYAFPRAHGFLHLAHNISQYDYLLPHPRFTSGVLLVSTPLLRAVNGYSNGYWGWGGEDDDLALRLMRHFHGGWPATPQYDGQEFPRLAGYQGRFVSLEGGSGPRDAALLVQNRERLQAWQAAGGKAHCAEGLSTLSGDNNQLKHREDTGLYILLSFEVDEKALRDKLAQTTCSA